MLTPGQIKVPVTAPRYFGSTPVMPAVAVSSPVNTTLNVPAGQVGGAGYPAQTNTQPAGTGIAKGISGVVGALGDAAANYVTAGNARYNVQAPQPPQAERPITVQIPQFLKPTVFA